MPAHFILTLFCSSSYHCFVVFVSFCCRWCFVFPEFGPIYETHTWGFSYMINYLMSRALQGCELSELGERVMCSAQQILYKHKYIHIFICVYIYLSIYIFYMLYLYLWHLKVFGLWACVWLLVWLGPTISVSCLGCRDKCFFAFGLSIYLVSGTHFPMENLTNFPPCGSKTSWRPTKYKHEYNISFCHQSAQKNKS